MVLDYLIYLVQAWFSFRLAFKSKTSSGDTLNYFIIMRNPGEVSQCLQRNILLYHTPDISTLPNLLLVCYHLISSTS